MATAMEQKRIRDLITETVTALCKTSLNFRSNFSVEGLLGITIDNKEVFLININEAITSVKRGRHSVVDKMFSCSEEHDCMNENVSDSFESNEYMMHASSLAMQSHEQQPSEQIRCLNSSSSALHSLLTSDHRHLHANQELCSDSTPIGSSHNTHSGTAQLLSPRTVNAARRKKRASKSVCEAADSHGVVVKEEAFSDSELSDSQLNCLTQDFVSNSLCGTDKNSYREGLVGESSKEENSMLSETAVYNDSTTLLQYTVIPGANARGGAAMISSDGHRYGVKMAKADVIYWRCVVRNRHYNCRAVVIQRGSAFVQGCHDHCHPPQHAGIS